MLFRLGDDATDSGGDQGAQGGKVHEDLQRQHEVKRGSDRALGFVFAIFFFAIGCWPLFGGASVRAWAIGLALVFLVVALVRPRFLAPLNRFWVWTGLVLHRVVNPLVLGALFFVVVTPMSLLMRALGKDPLRLRFDRAAGSYWIERHPPGPAPDSMRNQF